MEDKINLDKLCAEYGYRFAKEVSRALCKLLFEEENIRIVDDLNRKVIPDDLKNKLRTKKIILSQKANICQLNSDKWLIEDPQLQRDFIIRKDGQKLKVYISNPKAAETLLTKALGVLQEQGLYAFALFCESRPVGEEAGAKKIKELTKELLKKLNFINNGNFLEELRKNDGLLTKLDDLMLAIQVLEKSLIYARYHAKAMKETGEETK